MEGAATFGLQVGFSLKMYQQEELKQRDFAYSAQAAVSREAAPQGLFSTMADGLDLSRAIKEVDLGSDFFKRINAKFTLAADLAAEKIAVVTVNVEYPGVRPEWTPPAQVAGFTFTPQDSTPKTFQTFLNKQLDLRYRYRITSISTRILEWEGNEPHFDSDWIVTTDPAPISTRSRLWTGSKSNWRLVTTSPPPGQPSAGRAGIHRLNHRHACRAYHGAEAWRGFEALEAAVRRDQGEDLPASLHLFPGKQRPLPDRLAGQ